MIGMNKCWRLNPGLTLVISLLLIALVILDRWVEYEYTLIPQEKERQEQRFNNVTARMWQTVSDLMLTDNRTTTESYITGYSADIAFEMIAVIDKGRVLLANQLALKGSTTKNISCYQRRWVSQAVSEFSPVIQHHPSRQNRLCAVMPITLLEQSNSLRPESLAVLVVEYNMSPAISSLQQHIWNPTQLVRHLIFALFVAALISVILKRSVIHPLNQIRQRMKEYAQGNVLARVELKGNCELMDVARNFNELADQISEAELEVRRSEERWVKALDGAGDGVWDLDLRSGKVFYSSQCKQMLGYQVDEIKDSPDEWTERVHPDDLPKAMQDMRDHLAGRTEVYRTAYRMRCKNGDYKWFFDRGMVFERDADGKALRVTGTHSDISEQKQTEAALQESQQQFELAMQGSNDGLWDWHISSNLVYFSPRWKEMLGYDDDELENSFQVWESLVHPDDLPLAKEEVARCVVGKKDAYEVEFRLQHKLGHWIYVLSRAIVVKDKDGHVARLVGTHMDLTEIRAVQKQLEESRQQLKKMAFYDALTGLPNRRLLENYMTECLEKSQQKDDVLAIAMMDLDGFKQVNDTLGHDVGDELLKAVSGRLTLCMRESDMIARLGGDEFVLLFTGLSTSDDVVSGLERVISVIGKPYMIAGNECHVTASIGVAFYPDDAKTGDTLLRYADLAMYRSKQTGRNRFSVYEDYMSDFDQENRAG